MRFKRVEFGFEFFDVSFFTFAKSALTIDKEKAFD